MGDRHLIKCRDNFQMGTFWKGASASCRCILGRTSGLPVSGGSAAENGMPAELA